MGKAFMAQSGPRTPSSKDAGASPLAAHLGPLEIQVMECLWRRAGETSVRGLQESFPGAAYTTLMTTLDRLFKKGLLERRACDRAYLYTPSLSREDLVKQLAAGVMRRLLGAASNRLAARPILSTLVETVSRRDAALLDELEALIQAERRKESGTGRGGGRR